MDPDRCHLPVESGPDFLANRLIHVIDRPGVEVASEQPVGQGPGETRLRLGRVHPLQPGLGLGRTLPEREVSRGRHLDGLAGRNRGKRDHLSMVCEGNDGKPAPFPTIALFGGSKISTDAPVRGRRFPVPWLVALGLVVLILAFYGVSRAASAGQVIGSVQVEGIEVGGLIPEEAEAALVDLEANLAESPATFTIGGSEVQITPASIGFDLDEATMVRRAMEIGRQGNFVDQFWWWLTHLFSTHELAVTAADRPRRRRSGDVDLG